MLNKKGHFNVIYPDMVKKYNNSMGGVDLNNMLISLYPVDIETRKQWSTRFFYKQLIYKQLYSILKND